MKQCTVQKGSDAAGISTSALGVAALDAAVQSTTYRSVGAPNADARGALSLGVVV